MRTQRLIALGAAALLALGSEAQAQYGPAQPPNYGPGYRGNISPYLNLFRGRNTGIDYYLGTRSEQQRRDNAREFRDDIDELERRDSAAPGTDESTIARPIQSGTPVAFGSTLGFYNNRQNFLAPTVGRMGGGGLVTPPRRSR